MKKRKNNLRAVFILLGLSLLSFTTLAYSATYYVATDGDDSDGSTWEKAYQTIQAAVTAASNTDIIIVGSSGTGHGTGSYTENVDVTMQVTIQSENGYATTTVISASVVDDVFYVASTTPSTTTIFNVTIDGFTVYGATSLHTGIYLENAKDCVIQNNRCGYDADHNNIYGIYLKNSNRNAILNNICNNDGSGISFGIYFSNSDRNTIAGNECKYNGQAGIKSYGTNSTANTISGNTFSNNDFHGIAFDDSGNNFILKNICNSNTSAGIYFTTSSDYNRVYLNSFNNFTNVSSSRTTLWRPAASTDVKLCYFYPNTSYSNLLGNYWSNYAGSDTNSDGVGDTSIPYSPGSDVGKDYRPLIDSDISNYHIQAWYLYHDSKMYEDDTEKIPFSQIVSASGSTIWTADEAAQVNLTFPSGQWSGQICLVDIDGLAPANGHTFTLQIGSSTNGSDFTAGPSVTLTADGTKKVFEYVTSSAAVPVSTGNYLALRITNNSATNYYAWTGGAWSYTSSPGDGDPNYSLPVELSAFTAQYINNTPTLYWSTQTETDNLGWYIYRNTESDFTGAGKISDLIAGHGTTSQPQDYIYEDIDELVVDHTYYYWLESIDLGGTINHFDRIVSITIPIHDDPHQNITPPQMHELRAEPNPFTESTSINFMLSETGMAEVSIYNIKGELVKSYPSKHVTADITTSFSWDGVDDNGKILPVGIYLYKFQVNGRIQDTKRIILMR